MKNKHLLILMILILSTLSVVGGGVLRWLFGGSDSEEKDEYEDSDEVPDGPFVMVTETYIPEEDYDL